MKFKLSIFIVILIQLFANIQIYAQQITEYEEIAFRKLFSINAEWQYIENRTNDPQEIDNQRDKFENITLPHTWNQYDVTDVVPGFRKDVSWYIRTINVPPMKEYKNHYYLYFEGINTTSEFFINNKKIAANTGGYIGIEIDITEYLKNTDGGLELKIRVDNSLNKDVIPSQKADFYIMGGIVRDAWLKITPPEAIKNIKITNVLKDKKNPEKGFISTIETKQVFYSKDLKNYQLIYQLKDKSFKIVSTKTVKIKSASDTSSKVDFAVKNPALWSPDSPNLYNVTVLIKQGNKTIDSINEKTGFRWFEFKEKGAFYLNGKRLLIKGTHRHEDHAGYGIALPNEFHYKDMKLIKDMGGNFVRLAHYPQDPEVYKWCDSLGIMVWDELPWCRGGIGGETWKNNTKNILQRIINQNYNHTSIIMWSLGNEIDWVPDFEGGDDTSKINTFLRELNTITHKMDPNRVTCMRKYAGAANIVDVFSPSIWSGWYAGFYKGYEDALKKSFDTYKRFVHMEYGGSSIIGRHTPTPITGEGKIQANNFEEEVNQHKSVNVSKIGDLSESYIVDLFDWYLFTAQKLEWFTGSAQWSLKDFPTPLRPEEPIPYVNTKGLCGRDGTPKDAYYVFKSYWTTSPKFCYIESHTWTKRYGALDAKNELCVFSNCEEVELFLNGKTQGRKKRNLATYPAQGLQWFLTFEEGKNEITAIGFSNNEKVTEDKIPVEYFTKIGSKTEKIKLSYENLTQNRIKISVLATDWDGNPSLEYSGRITFAINGPGELLKDLGTNSGSQLVGMANGEASIEIHRTGLGKIVVEVFGEGLKGEYLEIE